MSARGFWPWRWVCLLRGHRFTDYPITDLVTLKIVAYANAAYCERCGADGETRA